MTLISPIRFHKGEEEALVALRVAKEEAGDREAFWLYQLLRAIMTPERYRRLEEFIMLSPESYLPKTDFERLQFSKGEAKGKAESMAEGKAEVLLKLLTARLGSLEPAVAERILNQRDLPRLDAWINDAVLALDTEAAMTVLQRILST